MVSAISNFAALRSVQASNPFAKLARAEAFLKASPVAPIAKISTGIAALKTQAPVTLPTYNAQGIARSTEKPVKGTIQTPPIFELPKQKPVDGGVIARNPEGAGVDGPISLAPNQPVINSAPSINEYFGRPVITYDGQPSGPPNPPQERKQPETVTVGIPEGSQTDAPLRLAPTQTFYAAYSAVQNAPANSTQASAAFVLA